MNIYVCVKHVPDSAANIHIVGTDQIDERVAFLLNPYDEYAVTEAVKIKKLFPKSRVVAVTVGKPDAEKTLRSAMAMGADRGILVSTLDAPDSRMVARTLAGAIARDGKADLVFTGKESIDRVGMQTQFRLGVAMGCPVLTNALAVTVDENQAEVVCEWAGGGTRTYMADLPCVIGAGRGLNTPSYPTFPDIVKARKKPIDVVDMHDLEVSPVAGGEQVISFKPLTRQRACKAITGNAAQAADEIVRILGQEAKVLS